MIGKIHRIPVSVGQKEPLEYIFSEFCILYSYKHLLCIVFPYKYLVSLVCLYAHLVCFVCLINTWCALYVLINIWCALCALIMSQFIQPFSVVPYLQTTYIRRTSGQDFWTLKAVNLEYSKTVFKKIRKQHVGYTVIQVTSLSLLYYAIIRPFI